MPSADAVGQGKRDPHDFALWKAAKPDEPGWDTPWGPGRPGWHIECSAMARKYLGAAFDIHGGGMDLVFPHHENEIAQSACAGDAFASYWMHNAWVTTAGEKMSKSLGNSLLVTEVVKRARPIEVRYYLASAHYRSTLEFSFAALEEAATGFRRLEAFLERASDPAVTAPRPAEFDAAMDDDFSVPGALAVLHDTVRAGNTALAAGDRAAAAQAAASVRAMLAVIGLDPAAWESTGGDRLTDVVDRLVAAMLDQRAQARERKDYAAADSIRDALVASGITIEDTPEGPRWSVGAV
jgi:cysteinyl-tRNA synthetase